MTAIVIWGVDFGGRRERETRELIAEAKIGAPPELDAETPEARELREIREWVRDHIG